MPGRKPDATRPPVLFKVTKPMSDEPPPKTRPVWNAETVVPPKLNVSGSTSVRCCAAVSLVNGSVLTRVTGTAADAVVAERIRIVAAADATTAMALIGRRRMEGSPSPGMGTSCQR